MIGDKESLTFMMADLVDWCAVIPQWPRKFNPAAANSTKPENVIQYYRASSFALVFSGYNNTFALASSNPTTTQTLTKVSPFPLLSLTLPSSTALTTPSKSLFPFKTLTTHRARRGSPEEQSPVSSLAP